MREQLSQAFGESNQLEKEKADIIREKSKLQEQALTDKQTIMDTLMEANTLKLALKEAQHEAKNNTPNTNTKMSELMQSNESLLKDKLMVDFQL